MSMAFWAIARRSRPKVHLFSNELNRSCAVNRAPSYFVNRFIYSKPLIPELSNPDFISRDSQLELFHSVRFFAAPALADKQKKEVIDGPRLNEQITAQFIRLVSGEDHKVISRFDALKLAKNLKLDLVEVDRFAKPPVCKIFDFNKERYIRQMKVKERAKSKFELKTGAFKEIKFAAKIKQKDLQMKADMAKRLMESGHRVKCTAIEPTEDVDLETLLSRFTALINDVALEESKPKVEKKQAFVVVRHIKFGPTKKGSGKKASMASESIRNPLKDSDSMLTATVPLDENGDIVETGLEEPGSLELLDENAQTNKSEWNCFHGDENLSTVFDLEDEVHELTSNAQSGFATPVSSSVTSSTPMLKSALAHTESSMSMEVPEQGMANRYSRDPSSIPVFDQDARSSASNISRTPNLGKQVQFGMNTSPQMRQSQQLEVQTSKQASSHSSVRFSPTNSNNPAAQKTMNGVFKVPHQGKQPQVIMNTAPQPRTPFQAEVPGHEVPRQDSSHSIHNSPTKNYDSFSSQQMVPMPQSTPAETNRYSKRDPSDAARSQNTTVSSPYRNRPAPDSKIDRKPDVDNPEDGKWGRFSTNSSSNSISYKKETRAEIHKR